MKIGPWRLGRLPCEIAPARIGALDTEQIQLPDSVRVESLCDALDGKGHFCDPNVSFTINGRTGFHITHKIRRASRKDVQVEPLSFRANLKFFVMVRQFGVWLKKHFSHIPLPKSLAASVG